MRSFFNIYNILCFVLQLKTRLACKDMRYPSNHEKYGNALQVVLKPVQENFLTFARMPCAGERGDSLSYPNFVYSYCMLRVGMVTERFCSSVGDSFGRLFFIVSNVNSFIDYFFYRSVFIQPIDPCFIGKCDLHNVCRQSVFDYWLKIAQVGRYRPKH